VSWGIFNHKNSIEEAMGAILIKIMISLMNNCQYFRCFVMLQELHIKMWNKEVWITVKRFHYYNISKFSWMKRKQKIFSDPFLFFLYIFKVKLNNKKSPKISCSWNGMKFLLFILSLSYSHSSFFTQFKVLMLSLLLTSNLYNFCTCSNFLSSTSIWLFLCCCKASQK
jgi:hypothetical protein